MSYFARCSSQGTGGASGGVSAVLGPRMAASDTRCCLCAMQFTGDASGDVCAHARSCFIQLVSKVTLKDFMDTV